MLTLGMEEGRGQAEPSLEAGTADRSLFPLPRPWHQVLSSSSFLSKPIRDDHMGQLSLDFQSHKFPYTEPSLLPSWEWTSRVKQQG